MSRIMKAAGAVLTCSVLYPVLDGCWRGAYALSYRVDLLFHLKTIALASGLFFLGVTLDLLKSNRTVKHLV